MRSENQEGLPSHAPKRTNGADRRNDHSGRTQQGAQQPAGTKNLREANVELREEHPKTSQENSSTFLRGSMSAISFPKLPATPGDMPGDVIGRPPGVHPYSKIKKIAVCS